MSVGFVFVSEIVHKRRAVDEHKLGEGERHIRFFAQSVPNALLVAGISVETGKARLQRSVQTVFLLDL